MYTEDQPFSAPRGSWRSRMHIAITKPLFAWDCLQDSPSLATVKEFLASIPDARLLARLRQYRGRGRDDYPVHVLWGVLLLRIALRHVSFEATLGELGRNEALRRLIGIEQETDVPKSWNVSRFLDVLGQEPHFSELRRIFDSMVQRLGLAVPDLGKDTAGDSTALHARGKEQARKPWQAEIAAGLPQPSGGKKEYTDDDGKVAKIVEWFGYKLHLLVDAKHEVVLAYQVTTANAADCKSLPDLVQQGQANLPEGRIETLAYDKAADDNESHRLLHAGQDSPGDPEPPPVEGPDRTDASRPRRHVEHRLRRGGHGALLRPHEPADRAAPDGLHRLRTPAADDQVSLPGAARGLDLSARRGVQRGQVLRQDGAGESHDRPAAVSAHSRGRPRSSSGCTTAARRWNGSTHGSRSSGASTTATSRGARRFHAMVGAVLIVHVAFATLLAAAPRREGTLGKLRLGPIQKRWPNDRQSEASRHSMWE